MASRHLSLRIPTDLYERLMSDSKRTGQTISYVAQTLLEEGLRMEAHPGIVFRSGPAGRRAGLINGPDIWEVARVLRSSGEAGEEALRFASEMMTISTEQAAIAWRYYAQYQEEIDEWIRRIDDEAERAETLWQRQQELLRA